MQKLSGFQLPPNRPIVGDSLYYIESGIVTMFHRRCRGMEPLEYLPFAPELIGRPGVDIALGKGNDIANIEEHLERRGLPATPEQANEMLAGQAGVDREQAAAHGQRVRGDCRGGAGQKGKSVACSAISKNWWRPRGRAAPPA